MSNFFDRLLDGVVSGIETYRGKTPAPTPVAERASRSNLGKRVSTDSPYIDRYPSILGPLANPATVSSALRRAELGYMRPLCDLLSEMRETTPHMQAELGKREKALSRCSWSLSPAQTQGMGKKATRQANKIADDIRGRIESIDSLSDVIEHLSGGTYYGRSGAEIVYQRDRSGIGVREIVPVTPKRFSYAKNWRVHLFDEAGNTDSQSGEFPGIDIRETWPDKFIIHEPRTLGPELPTRQGLGRVLVWAALFWKGNTRYWLQFLELFANPWRFATFDKQADDNDIAHAKEAMIELSGMSSAVFPSGCTPKFLQVNDTDTFSDSHNAWLAEISKVINGGTLTSSMNGATGSLAAGAVHERESEKLTASDGRSMDATLRRDLVRPLVRLNFGDEASRSLCPILHLATEPPEDREKEATRIFGYVDRGGEVDADEVREKLTGLGRPEPSAPKLRPLGFSKAAPAADPAKPAAPKPPTTADDATPGAKSPSDDAADVTDANDDAPGDTPA